jgi:hypothetical protein
MDLTSLPPRSAEAMTSPESVPEDDPSSPEEVPEDDPAVVPAIASAGASGARPLVMGFMGSRQFPLLGASSALSAGVPAVVPAIASATARPLGMGFMGSRQFSLLGSKSFFIFELPSRLSCVVCRVSC